MKVATIIKNYLPHSHISALGVHMQQDFMNPNDRRKKKCGKIVQQNQNILMSNGNIAMDLEKSIKSNELIHNIYR